MFRIKGGPKTKGIRYSEEKIIAILKEHEAGVPAVELVRRHGLGLLLCLTVLMVPGCAGYKLPPGVTSANATWIAAHVGLPSSAINANGLHGYYSSTLSSYPHYWVEDTSQDLKPGVKLPAVIYLHGCAGFGSAASSYMQLLLGQGFAVIQPDSFARPGRGVKCYQGGMGARMALRHQEVNHALKEIDNLDWIDRSRLVLMGFSEGGNSTARWWHGGFKAYVVLGTNCRHAGMAVSTPADVPVLSLTGEHDEVYAGTCAIGARKNSGGMVIPNAGHQISESLMTRRLIVDFLNAVVIRDAPWSMSEVTIDTSRASLEASEKGIAFKPESFDSVSAIYDAAASHCGPFGKKSAIIQSPPPVFKFVCY